MAASASAHKRSCLNDKPSAATVTPSPGKNTEIVLVPCRAWKCVTTAISDGVDISEIPGCHLLRQMSSQ